MKKITFFGAKMQDLGGFTETPIQKQIKENIKQALAKVIAEQEGSMPCVLTGLNIGMETWAAEAAMSLKVPYHVYIPFDNPHQKWPKRVQMQYLYLLKQAAKKVQLDTGEFDIKKLHAKEIKLIDEADIICTAYNMVPGIMKYIERSGKTVIDIMPKEETNDDGGDIPF